MKQENKLLTSGIKISNMRIFGPKSKKPDVGCSYAVSRIFSYGGRNTLAENIKYRKIK